MSADRSDPPSDVPTVVAKPWRDMALEPATSLGDARYRVGDRLGAGGMGEVVAARDEVIGREIAIKRLLDEKPSDEQVKRFLREARIQGTLDHPAIPPVHELARDAEGRPYIVMKRVSGTTLAAVLAGLKISSFDIMKRFPRERLLRAFAEVCLAIEFAHTRGVIHRDLKPANIMLGEFGEVFVLDWGVAKVIGSSDAELPDLPSSSDDGATQAGSVIGTPGYMAPEQAASGALDARTDVFSLGRVLREILISRRGPDGQPLHDSPPELDELVGLATAEQLDARLASARELGERVQRYLDGDRDLAMRRTMAGQHLARARAALASDDRAAMLEAGRALALDPTLPGAAELVGRLMLEPPSEMPDQVKESLDQLHQSQSREQAKLGRVAYLLHAGLLALLLDMGIKSWFLATTLAVAVVTVMACAWYGSYVAIETERMSARKLLVIAGNAITVAIYARMFSPFLIAPTVATLMIGTLFGSPAYRRRAPVTLALVLTALGIVGPWIAELAGWISPTIVFDSHLSIYSDAIQTNPTLILTALSIYAPAFVFASAAVTLRRARVEEAAQTRLHVQAWRLRQLVPQI